MRKLAIVAIIVVILVAVVAFALLNLNRLVNRNREYILAQAEQALGRKVAVQDIGVTLWGGIGVRLTDFALADDPAFSSRDFIRADNLQVNVEFLPLLRKELRVKRLILREPVISVIRNKQGTFNFASLGGPGRAKEAPKAEEAPPARPGTLPLLVSLVDVADGEVRYLDKKEGVDLTVSRIDLKVEGLGVDQPVSIDLAAAVLAEKQNLKIQGRVGPLGPPAALTPIQELPLSGDVTLAPVELADLKRLPFVAGMVPNDLTAKGPLSLSAHAEGTLEAPSVTAKVDATPSTVGFGDHFRKPQGIPLHLTADTRVTPQRIEVKKSNLKLHTLELTGTGAMTRTETPTLHLDVSAGRTGLAGWDNMVSLLRGYDLAGAFELQAKIEGPLAAGRIPNINGTLALADMRATVPQVPQPLTAKSATVTFTGQRAEIPETSVAVGKSQMRLAAQVERFVPVTLTYRLAAPELWVADFRAGSGTGKKPEVLREVKSNGRVTMERGSLAFHERISSARGTLADLDYTNLQAVISMANQVVTIESFQLQALNGSLQGQGRYDMRKTPPHFAVTAQARSIDVAELFRPTSGTAATHIRGQANLDLNLSGSGNEWQDIQRALTGRGEAVVEKGALLDVNIAEGALTGLTGVPGVSQFISPNVRTKYPAIFSTQNTEFGQIKGSMNIREGKVYLDDLLMTAADWAVQGQGWITLDQELNLRAKLALSRQLSTDLIANAKVLRFLADREGRLEIPFALAGILPSVTPKPDLDHVARLVQRGLVEQGVEELTKGLRKKSSPPPEPAPPETQQPQPAAPEKPPEKKKPEEELLKSLKDLFRR